MNFQVLLNRIPIVGHLMGDSTINLTAFAIESVFVIVGAVMPLALYAFQNKKDNVIANSVQTEPDRNVFAIISSFIGMYAGKLISDAINSIFFYVVISNDQNPNMSASNTTNAASENAIPHYSQESRARSTDSGFQPYRDDFEANYLAEMNASRLRALSEPQISPHQLIFNNNLRQNSNLTNSELFLSRQTSDASQSDIFTIPVLELESASGDNRRPDNGNITQLIIR